MLIFPNIDPIAVKIGPINIYWYGVMYLIGFAAAYWLCYRRRTIVQPPWTKDEIIDLFFYGAVGVIFGGTWGYILFYEPQTFITDPLRALRFWEAGRSFHGGLIGVIVAVWIYALVHKRKFWAICDFVAPVVPIGLATGRLGNFINAELWGRVTDVPWGMVFPNAGNLPRHPSQLYEFALEGVLLFIILQWYSQKPRPIGSVSGLFLLGYGLFRFIVEFFREPDVAQGFVAFDWLTRGQELSLPMILVGAFIMLFAIRASYQNRRKT